MLNIYSLLIMKKITLFFIFLLTFSVTACSQEPETNISEESNVKMDINVGDEKNTDEPADMSSASIMNLKVGK